MSERRTLIAVLMSSILCCSAAGQAFAAAVHQVRKGHTTVAWDANALQNLGLRVESSASPATAELTLEVEPDSTLQVVESGGVLTAVQGSEITHNSVVTFSGPAGAVSLDGFVIAMDSQAQYVSFVVLRDIKDRTPMLSIATDKLGYDRVTDTLFVEGSQVTILPALADALGVSKAAGLPIGEFRVECGLEYVSGDVTPTTPEADGAPRGGNNGTVCGATAGPDVIVGTLFGNDNYTSQELPAGSGNWIDAFSVGTYSCNIGTQGLKWISGTNEHPVIAQNFFRHYTDASGVTHFEHLGQAWLKHGFTALQGNECGCGCQTGNGSLLGVGCSDPYGASLNGGQSSAGPKWQVNAHTGVFTYPPANPTWSGSVARRMQIHVADLNQAGARYFMEGQYVQPEDAQFGNGNNNASYIEVTVSGSGNDRTFTLLGSTNREQPGIRAWKDIEPSIEEVDVQVPNEGLFIVSAKATAIAGGFYHYEYAVQNLNSDRSARSFSVPLPGGVTVQNIGFHDVDYHDGDGESSVNRSGTDWTSSWTPGGAVTWSTPDFTAAPNGNALRWGTLYNFRFDADAPPGAVNVSLGMYKPGTPTSVSASIVGPAGPPPVCGDGTVEGGEECDPPGNGCSAQCEWICGDGVAHPPLEPCDSGGIDTAGCDSDCTPVECGDGHTNTAAGETCDDGGDSANCDGDCTGVSCGDGYINEAAGEECDPPGPNCDASCHRIPMCGDGVIDPGESCDDGNTTSGDGCSSTCQSEYNDDCVEAIPIHEGVTPFSTLDATTDGVSNGGLCQFGGQTYADIWYTYSPACSGNLTISTCNTADYDTDLVIYNTCACTPTSGSLLGCRDDTSGCSGFTSTLTVPVTAGSCYLIRVGGYNSDTDRGTGTIMLTNSGAPCGGPVCGNGNVEAGEQCDDGNTTNGDGCSSTCQIETPVCGNGNLEAGEQCDDGNTNNGDGCDSNCQFETTGGGDECNDCIPASSSTYFGSTADNTGAGNDSSCGGTNDVIDEWYCYIASCTGTATATTCQSATVFDTTLTVFDGCSGSELACNDDTPGSLPQCLLSGNNYYKSTVSWACVQGVTYYVRVAGFNGANGAYALDISCQGPVCGNGTVESGETCDDGNTQSGDGCDAFCQAETQTPDNDDCANAIVVCPSTIAGSTLNGTVDGSASCGTSNSTADVWYSYTPGSSGSLTLSTCGGGDYDTVLSVHSACPGTTANEVGCNDDDPSCAGNKSTLTVNVTGGSTYWIRVGGWNGATGAFVLVIDGPECGGTFQDCNNNGRDDAEDIACGLDNYCDNIAGSGDCNVNGIPDDCEIAIGSQSDCDGGPIGNWAAGAARVASLCRFCHGPSADSTGCTNVCPGPNIRNKTREQIRLHLDPPVGTHGGGQHPEYTRQDYADLEAFLSDTGSHGRPDGVPDGCQTLNDCDNDSVSDGCELEAGTQLDPDGDGIPSDCEGCPNDPNKTEPGNCGCGVADTAATGDMDGSGSVNGADIQLFVDGVMTLSTDPAYLCPGDFSADHVMDYDDMSGFIAALMAP